MMDTQKEGDQAGAQTQDQLWDIPGQVSGRQLGASRAAGACLSHLPLLKCSNTKLDPPHSKRLLCPMLPHPTASEYHNTNISEDSLRSPQPGVGL